MFYRFITTCLIAGVLLLGLGACGHDSRVAAPGTTDSTRDTAVSDNHHMCWGMWDVAIDSTTGELTSVPLRSAEFNANVVRFMQAPLSPVQMMTMTIYSDESKIPMGLITIDITLRHPFPANKMFRGFDVRGIIMTSGANVGIHDPTMTFTRPGQTEMLNADGFTRWWNQEEFTTTGTIFGYTEGHYAKPGFTSNCNLNPYKLHTPFLDYSQPIYQLDTSTRATFPVQDGAVKRRYKLQFDPSTQPIYKFKYAIDASWSLPNPSYKPNYPVEAYDNKANCQEPWLVRIKEYEEIPYWVDEWVSGGNVQFLLSISDWQANGGNTVINQISHVWVESPTMWSGAIDVKNSMVYVSSDNKYEATYRVKLANALPSGIEDQQMLITVESASPSTYAPQIQGDPNAFKWPTAPLAAYCLVDVPVTNLTPEGEYAYVYFLPCWCATMRAQCSNDADNQKLMRNFLRQNIDGPYNDFTHVKVYEGRSQTGGQNADSLAATCASLGYSFQRDFSPTWSASGARAVITILWRIDGQPINPPFTTQEMDAMLEFIQNGGLLFFMCEASMYFNIQGMDSFFDYLGMLMEYGGGATPEMSDGYTDNITWHFLTDEVKKYHYFTVGQWITQDPHVLLLVSTEYDEKIVLMYPLPLE